MHACHGTAPLRYRVPETLLLSFPPSHIHNIIIIQLLQELYVMCPHACSNNTHATIIFSPCRDLPKLSSFTWQLQKAYLICHLRTVVCSQVQYQRHSLTFLLQAGCKRLIWFATSEQLLFVLWYSTIPIYYKLSSFTCSCKRHKLSDLPTQIQYQRHS